MLYKFLTSGHPASLNKTPQAGDQAIVMHFETDEGGRVEIHMGQAEFQSHLALMLAMLKEDPELRRRAEKESSTIKANGNY